MEFKRGNPERRDDRRMCPRCETRCGEQRTCPRCGKETRPRIRVVWTIHGKRHRQLTNTWREDIAREVLQGIEADYWRKQRLGVTRDIGGTVANAIVAFEKTRADCSDSWQAQIRNALYPLRDGLDPDTDITQVDRDDLQQYLDEGLATRSPSTMRSYMLVLRCMFGWLEREGWIRIDPTRRIQLPRARERRHDCLMPDQVGPVLEACFAVSPDFGPVAMAIILGSFRKGELVNLRHTDLDLHARWARITDFAGDDQADPWSPKTESSHRTIPLHPQLADTLARLDPILRPDGTPSPWLFPITDPRKRKRLTDRRGRPQPVIGDRRAPTTNAFGRHLRQALTLAGIDHPVTIHGLRRTFAVLLQDTGAPDSVIRQAMGHAPRGVTERHYLPRRDPVVQRWVDRIRLGLSYGYAERQCTISTGLDPA